MLYSGFSKVIKPILLSVFVLPLFFSVSLFAKHETKYKVAICAIFRDEAPYLKEWIEFHKLVGVEHFYLFNHLSEDDYKTVLAEYINLGLVDLFDHDYPANRIKNWNLVQCKAYNKALKLAKKEAKWLGFIDTDEFLFPVEHQNLKEFLADYEDFAGLVVNWQLYGTSGIQKIFQSQLMIKELTYKAPIHYAQNAHVKTIVQPKFVKKFINPHYATFKSGYYSVNSNKEKVIGAITPYVLIDKIRINHYWSRDEEFFHRVKVPRMQNWNCPEIYERFNIINQEYDPAILKYVPELQETVFKNNSKE